MEIVYFSNVSENTHRFVQKLGVDSHRIPVRSGDTPLVAPEEYLLVVPTYGGGREGGAVPKQVIKFLNDPDNRRGIRGVIATGNTNFGAAYCLAGRIVAAKCEVPLLYQLEILGTEDDVQYVTQLINQKVSTQ